MTFQSLISTTSIEWALRRTHATIERRRRLPIVIGVMGGVALGATAGGIAAVGLSGQNDGAVASPVTASTDPRPGAPVSAPAGRRIVMTVASDPSLKYNFPTISELAASSVTKAVVEGTVTEVEDIYVDGVAYRVLTVDVKESRKMKVGKAVTVYEDGGVVPYAEILPELQAHSKVKLPPAASDAYVDVRFLGAQHTEVGNEIVAFVQPNPNSRDLIPADYQLIGSVQGLLVRDASTGLYLRRGVGEKASAGVERSLSRASLDATLTKVAGTPIRQP